MSAGLKSAASALVLAIGIAVPFEGLLTTAEPDIATGQPNICYGDTHDVKFGDTATLAECNARLLKQMRETEAVVDRCYPPAPAPKVKAAIMDLGYNVGPGKKGVKDGICVLKSGRMPTIRVRAYAGNWLGVCNGLLAWRSAGGKVLRGLDRRRQSERVMCLEGTRD